MLRAGIVLLSILLLLGAAFGRWPYSYYTFLRLVVCGTALYLALTAYERKSAGWTIVLALTGALFNPIIPVRMRRTEWLPFDIAAAVVLAMVAFWLNRKSTVSD